MKQCPLHDKYRFRTACRIETCKMYNEQTPNKCLALDTTFASNDKTLSDAELIIYKFPGMSQREVSTIRKRAVNRVQAVIALNQVVQHIRARERPEDGLNRALMQRLSGDAKRLLKKSFRSKLFRIKHLDIEVWMMPFVLNPEYANKVVPGFDRFSVHLLFRWTPGEYKTVVDSLTEARNFRGQSKVQPNHNPSSRTGN